MYETTYLVVLWFINANIQKKKNNFINFLLLSVYRTSLDVYAITINITNRINNNMRYIIISIICACNYCWALVTPLPSTEELRAEN